MRHDSYNFNDSLATRLTIIINYIVRQAGGGPTGLSGKFQTVGSLPSHKLIPSDREIRECSFF